MELEELAETPPQENTWVPEEDCRDPAPAWVDPYEF